MIDLNAHLDIDRLGARGEGVSRGREGLIFTPFALPGEKILAEVDGDRGKLVEVLAPSPDRVPAPARISPGAAAAPCRRLAPLPIRTGSAGWSPTPCAMRA